MPVLDRLDTLFITTSFVIQVVLLLYFALRKWQFKRAMEIGWLVYALAVPAVVVSIILLWNGRPWYLWLAGFLYAMWAIFGYMVDIARPVAWRTPILWSVFIPYVLLYTAALMFYWWPLASLWRSLWYLYTVLYAVSTYLNVTSHR